jgi:hypothetical protein
MRRILAVLALVALGSIGAWADEIVTINQTGTIAISNMAGTGGLGTIGASVITSSKSPLTNFYSFASASKSSLGYVSFSTGTLESGSVSGGGVFSSTGSTFTVTGQGKWMAGIGASSPYHKTTLFSGSFVGPIDWTLISKTGPKATYALTGEVKGVLSNGRTITLQATEDITILSSQQGAGGTGHITLGNTQLAVPEPGTLSLLGTGIVAIGGVFRRKLMSR